MVLDRDSKQVMKFVYMRSHYSELGTETRIAPTEAIGVNSFDLHLVCSEYGLETFV
jgi:hypothetical protein